MELKTFQIDEELDAYESGHGMVCKKNCFIFFHFLRPTEKVNNYLINSFN